MERSESKSRKPANTEEMRTAAETEASSSSSAPPPPSWIELPEDVTANILQRLGAQEMLESAQLVCTTWRKVCLDPAMWRVIDLENPGVSDEEYSSMCRCAMDRSQGQLIELRIANFGDDELLCCIVDGSSHLQRLTLANTYYISGTALSEAVKKLPQLEELHLTMMPSVHAKDIETIGISCPMLKSFTCNGHWSEDSIYSDDDHSEYLYCNEHAVAIGKNMPNLRHLQLLENWMKNEGLQAILDGCPHLESLDIRKCYGLDLEGDLGKRCSQQIKDLRVPSDPISDSEWPHGEHVDLFGSVSSYSDLSDFSLVSFGDGYYNIDYDYEFDYDYDYEVDGDDYC